MQGNRPTPAYYEATERGDLSWRIAQAVQDRQRKHGPLETKEIRNCVTSVLRSYMSLDAEEARYRLVGPWKHWSLTGG